MASDPLDCSRNTSALRIHGGGTLPACPGCRLRVEALRRSILLRLRRLARNQVHLMAVSRRLCRVRRWCALLVHSVVHGWSLRVGRLMELVHLYRVGILHLSRLCCSLFAGSLSLLLLLNTRSDGLVERRVLQVHWRHKRPGELLLSDKRMQLGLLGRPPLQGIDG